MRVILILIFALISLDSYAQPSMRRCALLPITDSVGGAIGFKVFEEVETSLKGSNWCTYVSNSPLIDTFSRYRENLPRYLQEKEVLALVSGKLSVGSLIRIGIVSEIKSIEVVLDIFGDNGEDLYFSETTSLKSDQIQEISNVIINWLDMYSKAIPYDAKVNGVLGDQLTLDVGKGYPIKVGQSFLVKRPVRKKHHPLLKKIVDWESELLAEGKVSNISENQALGLVKNYNNNKKIAAGDWIRLGVMPDSVENEKKDEKEEESPGVLGVLSVAMFGTSSSVDTSVPTGSNRMSGNLFGIDFRVEAWITRNYFAALEVVRSIGSMSKASGGPEKEKINANNGSFKLAGGYKYLPIGFFYGPQVDIFTGYANHTFDLDYSVADGFGKNSISGLLVGANANVPINREYRLFASAEFLPFPTFSDTDDIYGDATSASAMELEIGIKYHYTLRMTIDGSVETISRKAKFDSSYKEVSYKDNLLKIGVSFNF